MIDSDQYESVRVHVPVCACVSCNIVNFEPTVVLTNPERSDLSCPLG